MVGNLLLLLAGCPELPATPPPTDVTEGEVLSVSASPLSPEPPTPELIVTALSTTGAGFDSGDVLVAGTEPDILAVEVVEPEPPKKPEHVHVPAPVVLPAPVEHPTAAEVVDPCLDSNAPMPMNVQQQALPCAQKQQEVIEHQEKDIDALQQEIEEFRVEMKARKSKK